MTIDKRLILPFAALVGGAAVAAALALRMRHNRRRGEKSQQKTELNAWEGEGGNPAPSAIDSQST